MKAETLKGIRVRLGLTQGEMAKELHVSRSYYNAMERGRRAIVERTASHARLLSRTRR